MVIHVIDEVREGGGGGGGWQPLIATAPQDPHSLSRAGGLEDVSLVDKYVMPDEVYDKRKNTLREYKREQLKANPDFKFFPKKHAEPAGPVGPETVEGIAVGNRCEVYPGERRGEVKFVGEAPEVGPGFWVSRSLPVRPSVPRPRARCSRPWPAPRRCHPLRRRHRRRLAAVCGCPP